MNDNFDYSQVADLYQAQSGSKNGPMHFQRFASAAIAIRFAVEKLSPELLRRSALEVGDERFEGAAILGLYDGPGYPLPRLRP